MYGAGRSRITHPFATLTTKQSLMDPVRLACVKHAASVHPEPESNPPQKNFAESQHVTLKNKKIDDRLIRKGASHENLTVLQGLPATRERADDELAIIDYKEVVQITLLSSQTTTHQQTVPNLRSGTAVLSSEM